MKNEKIDFSEKKEIPENSLPPVEPVQDPTPVKSPVVQTMTFDVYFSILQRRKLATKPHHKVPMQDHARRILGEVATQDEFDQIFETY